MCIFHRYLYKTYYNYINISFQWPIGIGFFHGGVYLKEKEKKKRENVQNLPFSSLVI